MKLRLSITMPLAVFMAGGIAWSTIALAENKETSLNQSTYYAIVKCVDSMFYDGGYDVGDKDRESLITEALALKNQPAYSEELLEKIDTSKVVTSEYMPVYIDCIGGDLYEKVDAIAKKHGIEYMD